MLKKCIALIFVFVWRACFIIGLHCILVFMLRSLYISKAHITFSSCYPSLLKKIDFFVSPFISLNISKASFSDHIIGSAPEFLYALSYKNLLYAYGANGILYQLAPGDTYHLKKVILDVPPTLIDLKTYIRLVKITHDIQEFLPEYNIFYNHQNNSISLENESNFIIEADLQTHFSLSLMQSVSKVKEFIFSDQFKMKHKMYKNKIYTLDVRQFCINNSIVYSLNEKGIT